MVYHLCVISMLMIRTPGLTQNPLRFCIELPYDAERVHVCVSNLRTYYHPVR
jgi:hypothetical protein